MIIEEINILSKLLTNSFAQNKLDFYYNFALTNY